MKEIYNFAIIGCGWIAESKHIPGITNNPDARITALCDIIPERAERLKAQFGLEISKSQLVLAAPIKSFGSYEVKCKLGSEVSGTIFVLVVEDK